MVGHLTAPISRRYSMATFTKDEIVYRTCQVLVRLFRNNYEEDERGCIHTRLFSHILHPETDYVLLGYTEEARLDPKPHLEHVVPCATLVTEVCRLIKEGLLPDDQIASLLQKHWKVAYLSQQQAHCLDHGLRYKYSMPDGWNFEEGDTYARLIKASIRLEGS
jgi:hypothetical protein